METRHLASLGARPIPRSEFVELLRRTATADFCCAPGHWPADAVSEAFRKH